MIRELRRDGLVRFAGNPDLSVIPFALQPPLLETVSEYLGCEPCLSYVKTRYSLVGLPEKMAQQWHRDSCTTPVLKAIVYLNDVQPGGGPFCYVVGSHLFPDEATRRMTNEDVQSSFDERFIVRCYGAIGDVVLADTRGLHKGEQPTHAKRGAMIFTYVTNPNHDEGTAKNPIRKDTFAKLTEREQRICRNFKVI